MERPHLRPRFRAVVPCHPDHALANFEKRLDQPDCLFEGSIKKRHLSLTLREEYRHAWSPVLNVDAEPLVPVKGISPELMGTLLRGHFGPHPNIWTLFLALYAGIIFSALFMTVLGYAQWMAEQTPWAFAVLPIAAIAVSFLFTSAHLGQKKAQAQMQQLQEFFDVLTCAQEMLSIKAQEPHHEQPIHLKGACSLCQRACERRAIPLNE